MKYILFGDIHGRDLSDLENILDSLEPDGLICTCDFDQVSIIHQFMELEKKYLNKNKFVVKVIGNHDFSILYNDPINSSALKKQKKDISELHYELLNNKRAYSYIHDLLYSSSKNLTTFEKLYLDKDRFASTFSTLVVHAGLDGNLLSYPNCPDNIKHLWYRIESLEDYKKNFDKMSSFYSNGNIKILIRGHDHEPEYAFRELDGSISIFSPSPNIDSYVLQKDRMHIINPGPFFMGNYAIIDTDFENLEDPIVSFKKV